MSGDLKELGEKFRKTREEMHLTLREVENSTSIRSGFIQAIENGTINDFLAGVYALGFIKQYASFLQLDIERIMKEYPKVFQMRKFSHDFNYGIGTLETRSSLSGGMKWLPNLLWAGGIATAIVITYYFAKAVGIL